MKTLLSAYALACLSASSTLVSAAVIAPRQTFDTSGKCLSTNPKTFSSQPTCGEAGSVSKPAGAKSFKVYSNQECATRCYATTTHCVSFSVTFPSGSTKPGTCTTYTASAASMGFKKSSTSAVKFYAANCYTYTAIDDTPVQDGGFQNSGTPVGDPWSTSGSASTDISYDGSHYATDYASFNSGHQKATIGQSVPTCPGETYQLKYETSDSYTQGHFAPFTIVANGVLLRNQTKDVGSTMVEQPPLYFTAAHPDTTLQFHLDTPDYPEVQIDAITDVVLSAVFRGSLPAGTVVKTA